MRSAKELDDFTSDDIEQVLKYRVLLKEDKQAIHSQEVKLWVVETGKKYSEKAFKKVWADYPMK